MAENDYLPAGYEVPTSGGGYTKLEAGENRLRIVSKPLFMWIVWEDGKVTRLPYNGPDSKPAKPTKTPKDGVKHAWAVIAYNYRTKEIEVFEIDKASIQADLVALIKSADWGAPKQYDVIITKKGSGMDTEYKTLPCPKTAPSQELVQSFTDTPINLDNLLVKDGNPFLANAGSKANTQTQQTAAKVVTPENWVAGDKIPDGYVVGSGGRLEANKLPF